MTTTNAERCRRHKARLRGEYVPPLPRGRKPSISEDARRARLIRKQTRRTLSAARKMLATPPLELRGRLREAQPVTWWNVRTGRISEDWE